MSAEDANLKAQVEAVLGTLVKAATVELIKLFESRFRVAAPSPTPCAGGKETFEVTNSLSTGGTKRSVGVQVEPQGTFGMLNFLFLGSCCAGRDPWRRFINCNSLLYSQRGFSFMHQSSASCTVLLRLH